MQSLVNPNSYDVEVIGRIADVPLPNIASSAVLAELSIGAFNPQRTDERVTEAVHTAEHAARSSGKYVKRLYADTKQFVQIKTLEMRARHVHRKMTMPWSDGGQRLLITSLLPEYVTGITEIEQQFWGVVTDIQENYDAIMRYVQYRMGNTFDATLYPSADNLPKYFKFHHARVPVPEVNDFDKVASSAQQIMRDEFAKHLEHIRNGIVEEVRENTKKVLQKMSERLDFSGENGDKKTFKNTLVDNVRDWHEKMGQFNNVVKLPDIDTLYGQVGGILADSNPEVLRVNADVRRSVKSRVDAILTKMDW